MSIISLKDSLAIHAHALCNITALNNEFAKIKTKEVKALKLSNCQAYELLAKFAGFNSFNGLKAQSSDDLVVTIKPTLQILRKHISEVFGERTKIHTLLESRIFEYLTCQNFQLHPIYHEDFAYSFAYTKPCSWHSASRSLLELNFVDGFTPDFMQGFTLSMLYSANILSLYAPPNESPDVFEELALSGGLENSVVAFRNAPNYLSKKIAQHSNAVGFHILHHFDTKSFSYKRGVMFYMAKALGVVPIVKDTSNGKLLSVMTVRDGELESIHKEIYKEAAKAVMGHSANPAYQRISDFNNSDVGVLPNFNVDKKMFLSILNNFYKLTAYFDEDTWVALDACPENVPAVFWNEYAVSYMNAFLDYMVMFFDINVLNKRINIKNIYINKAGMFVYKSEGNIEVKHPKTKEHISLSANDFSLFMNALISQSMLIRKMDVTIFSQYMSFALREIATQALNSGKGVDDAPTLLKAFKSLF